MHLNVKQEGSRQAGGHIIDDTKDRSDKDECKDGAGGHIIDDTCFPGLNKHGNLQNPHTSKRLIQDCGEFESMASAKKLPKRYLHSFKT